MVIGLCSVAVGSKSFATPCPLQSSGGPALASRPRAQRREGRKGGTPHGQPRLQRGLGDTQEPPPPTPPPSGLSRLGQGIGIRCVMLNFVPDLATSKSSLRPPPHHQHISFSSMAPPPPPQANQHRGHVLTPAPQPLCRCPAQHTFMRNTPLHDEQRSAQVHGTGFDAGHC